MIKVPKVLFHDMIEHCRKELPYETCGILSGEGDHVLTRWEFHNTYKHRHRYFIDKDSVQEVLNRVKEKGEEVIGIYHTHPTTDPIPSSMDLIHHPDPNVKMMIVSFRSNRPGVKCYEITQVSYVDDPFIVE